MRKQPFTRAWRFYLGDPPQSGQWGKSVDQWREVDLPHDWSIELDRSPDSPSGVNNGWFLMGRGWYVKTFRAPAPWQGKTVLVEFEGVYMNAEVWLNQDFLGFHPYGYTTFSMDLSPYLQYGVENTLRVKVENSAQPNS